MYQGLRVCTKGYDSCCRETLHSSDWLNSLRTCTDKTHVLPCFREYSASHAGQSVKNTSSMQKPACKHTTNVSALSQTTVRGRIQLLKMAVNTTEKDSRSGCSRTWCMDSGVTVFGSSTQEICVFLCGAVSGLGRVLFTSIYSSS